MPGGFSAKTAALGSALLNVGGAVLLAPLGSSVPRHLRAETGLLSLNLRSKPQQHLENEMSSELSLITNKETLPVREVVFDLLRELGINTIFGNPGSTELAFLTPWPADLRCVLALQEASAVATGDFVPGRRSRIWSGRS